MASRQEIEAFFLNHDSPIFERIQEAEDMDAAEILATDCIEEDGMRFKKQDLLAVITKIRSS